MTLLYEFVPVFFFWRPVQYIEESNIYLCFVVYRLKGVPPLLGFGRLQKPQIVQKRRGFWKILAQKRCKYQCFSFLRLAAMEDAIFEFVAIYGVLCMCFLKTLWIPVFFKRWFKNPVKYSISDMWSCQSVANSGVFATRAFFGVAKTS